MIDKLIKKYETLLNTLKENKKIADSTDFYPYSVDIKNTREYLKDLKALKKQLTIPVVGCSSERQKELIEAYKECFELFIPSEKWDEATLFLGTYNCGLAKDMAKKQRYK